MVSRPVRFSLWIFGLFALAVGIALAGRYGSGYVVLVLPPWRIDLSLILFVFLLLLGFAGSYVLFRLAENAWNLPEKSRLAKAERERDKAREAVYAGQRALFAGQFIQAEDKAKLGMRHPDTRDLAYALAAWAAYEGGKYDAAVPYLEQIHDPESMEMRDTSKAYMLLNDGKSSEALTILRDIASRDGRNPGVLKMKVEAEMAEGKWDDVLTTLMPLTRLGLLPEAAAQQIRYNAELNRLNAKTLSREELWEIWKALPGESRYDVAMASVVAKKFNALRCGQDAIDILEQTIDKRGNKGWDSDLVAEYAECNGNGTLAQIEQAEKWLRAHARDATLLLALGKLCMRQGLWGKAQSYLEASTALSPSPEAHLTLAQLLKQLGKHDEALRHSRRSAELAN